MILSRTPMRISFFGGGTDFPQWYKDHPGAILGTTIDKYCYVTLHDGQSWCTYDLPTKSGIASSSAYTVGLLRVCTKFDKAIIAKLATTWEQDKMAGLVGSQDQYLCAHGGFHLLRFYPAYIKDTVLPPDMIMPLQDYLMLFDTHSYRMGSFLLSHQLERMKQNRKILIRMVEMVDEAYGHLREHDYTGFGQMLNEEWRLKKRLSKYVSTPQIDSIYDVGLGAGAIAGKLLGGGGGGFMLFFVEPEKQEAVKDALSDLTLCPFKFETEGTKIIYHDN